MLHHYEPDDAEGNLFFYTDDRLRTHWKKPPKKRSIEDLRFHDPRHEATGKLFEKALDSMKVVAITSTRAYKY